MKRLQKKAAILLVAVLAIAMVASFAACGEKTRYNYVSLKAEGSYADMMGAIFDPMYKGSYILVSENSIEWVIDDVKEKMSCKKDGDRVVLGGDYLERIKKDVFGGSVEVEYYGQKNGENYQIIMEEKLGDIVVKITMNFEKA